MLNFLYKFISHLQIKFFSKNIYKNYGSKKEKRALVYYKNEVLYAPLLAKLYNHTNDWEILEICKILNDLGYSVDILSRGITKKDLSIVSDEYDLFIGNAAGNSGKLYVDIAKKLKKAKKIFYAAGPYPEESNRLIIERYDYFEKRNGIRPKELRMITSGDNTNTKLKHTNAIFCIGKGFCENSYKKFYKGNIYPLLPSSSPHIEFNKNKLINRSAKEFLYFGGNGAIVKGLDLLMESFFDLPEFSLHICGPIEQDLIDFYGKRLIKADNIILHGFVNVGSELFNEITERCGFIILPSCSEGCATSVTTCMRKGLIPIITYESGVEIGDFGFLIKSIKIDDLKKQINEIGNLSKKELEKRSLSSYNASKEYSQKKFSQNFRQALINFLK